MHRRPHRHRRRAATGRPSRGRLRDRLVLGVATIVAVLVGAAPAVGQSLSDGTPVNVIGPPATVLSADAHGQGRLVEAFGDVRRARNIAVIVPGVGWTGSAAQRRTRGWAPASRGAGAQPPRRDGAAGPGHAGRGGGLARLRPTGRAQRGRRTLRPCRRRGSPAGRLRRQPLALGHGERGVPQLRLGGLRPRGPPPAHLLPRRRRLSGDGRVDPGRPAHDGDRVGRPRPRRPDRGRPPHPGGGIRPRCRPDGDRLRGPGRSRSTAHTGTTATSSPARVPCARSRRSRPARARPSPHRPRRLGGRPPGLIRRRARPPR